MLKIAIQVQADLYKARKIVFIEQPWVNGQIFPRSGLMMMRSATILEVACLEIGFKPVLVHPLVWRKELYGNGHPKDTKATALKYIEENFDYEVPVMGKTGKGHTPDHNVAEAICIATYGGKQMIKETGS